MDGREGGELGANKKDRARRKQKRDARVRKRKQQHRTKAPTSSRDLVEAASRWPVVGAYTTPEWRENGTCGVALVRGTEDGRYAVAFFLVDRWCLGAKVADVRLGLDRQGMEAALGVLGGDLGLEPCKPELVAAIVEVGASYAASLGLRQDSDLPTARLMLQGLDPAEAGEVVAAGMDGKPMFVAGPYDDADAVVAQLQRQLGADGFHYVAPLGFE